MSFSDPKKIVPMLGVKRGGTVADLGAGSGFYSVEIAREVGPEGKVYAIDVVKELLTKIKDESLKNHAHNIEIIWGDIEKKGGTKLADSSVDMVVLANVLFQVQDKESVVQEASRILKQNGSIVVIDWVDSFGGLGPSKETVFSAEKARELMRKSGFSETRSMRGGDHHYVIIFKKR